MARRRNQASIGTTHNSHERKQAVWIMSKVSFLDKRVFKKFLEITSILSGSLSVVLLFVEIPGEWKLCGLGIFVAVLALAYLLVWVWSNTLNHIDINIEGSDVTVKVGDIFQQPGLKVIAFNEYFDTQVDNKIISDRSLNGIFVNKHLEIPVSELDRLIEAHPFEDGDLLEKNENRPQGKKQKYRLGTIFVYEEYLLTAFAKFDESNRAVLEMPEYLEFLINFWDKVNNVYAQKNVTTTIFGSGVTRIKGHKTISDEDLLKIMLWTFRISEMRFKYPAKLTIVIHKDKIDQISLLDIKSAKNGV